MWSSVLAKAAERVERLIEHGGATAFGKYESAACTGKRPGDALGREMRLDGQVGAARLEDREHGGHPVQIALGHHADHPFAGQPARTQGAGYAVSASIELAVRDLSRAVQGRDGIGPRPRLVLENLVGPAVGELPARSGEDRHHAFTHVTSPSPGCRPTARGAGHSLPS